MSEPILKEIDVTNFRSIRGHIHAPLDAKVVLIHGENGAGKTSLLSAIELALTGSVQSLSRADADYTKQLLHRLAEAGSVSLTTRAGELEQRYETLLDASGAHPVSMLDQRLAAFFSERAYLPQSMLGQLLQIYQESGSDADSPLAKFVGKLLGLDRLDALEAGLKPLTDIRNVRKVVEGWSGAETEKTRLERLVDSQTKTRSATTAGVDADLKRLQSLCDKLELGIDATEATIDTVADALRQSVDADAFETLTDRIRELGSIRREVEQAEAAGGEGEAQARDAEAAGMHYADWMTRHSDRAATLRARIELLLPGVSLPGDLGQYPTEALAQLRAADKEVGDRVAQARTDEARINAAHAELMAASDQRQTIDREIASISANAGSLASALAEVTAFLDGDVCPVCDRHFAETGQGPLEAHVHTKVRRLSGSAARLLTLGRSRGDVQLIVERLEREIEALGGRRIDAKTLADLDRRATEFKGAAIELESLAETLREGGRLLAEDVAARRAVSEIHSRNAALLAARETLGSFAISIGAAGLSESETFGDAASRLQLDLMERNKLLGARLEMRRQGAELIVTIRNARARRVEVDARIAADLALLARAEGALAKAQALRDHGISIRNTVDAVRSAIIRREFNDRLNRLWRDLFVRLAPAEPFVPAFRIPPSSTQRLQPKLITDHRFGGQTGGTPGAMLSAGNLNTAALTLFVALHLSVPKELPWLILDDPVQSMDDVHIAHFAALLRTLSKEHGRQIFIAVHDRQLFEYLRLELSPAFHDDSLLTIELSRGPRRDTLCSHQRYAYKEEATFLVAA
ncbi:MULTISPECIES: AAA family ATPase [Alphaproteobacteria]|uniref:AAA family ATPase n=1 Tax=Alphaproteobacteria TaxID=28211 RepID=UPI000C48E53B|nr:MULTISPECIES: AAA family ATPase [Alphaproteobacteria]MBS86545.1 hypothetical protein [Sphingobium sp.]TAJ30801.1 MAG: DUF2813 domain-containing protein [Bosea sp. (in: a-proteobacteria)]